MSSSGSDGVVTMRATNASIDRVVFQIEMLSSQIDALTNKIDGAVNIIKERGDQTVASFNSNFDKDTIQNVERMLGIVSEKTHDWPVTALMVAAITALVLIAITILLLMAKGGEKIAQRQIKKRILVQDHDVECL